MAVGCKKVLAFLALAWSISVQAQSWPTGPVRLVVPFPPGGTTDLMARLFAKELQGSLSQTVIVENRGGAGGAIAAEAVARSAADGHTLLFGSNSVLASNVSLFRKLSYNPIADFTPVMRVGEAPLVLLVRTDSPIRTLQDFVRVAREKPGRLSGGYGSSSVQAALAQLGLVADVKLLAVPYKAVNLAVNDLLAGVIDFAFADLGPATPLTQSGRLRALGVAQASRVVQMPDWPAIGETYPSYENLAGWFAIAAPAQTPAAVVERIHLSLKDVLNKKDVRDKLTELGVTIKPLAPREAKAFVVSEVDRWRRLFAVAGVSPE